MAYLGSRVPEDRERSDVRCFKEIRKVYDGMFGFLAVWSFHEYRRDEEKVCKSTSPEYFCANLDAVQLQTASRSRLLS